MVRRTCERAGFDRQMYQAAYGGVRKREFVVVSEELRVFRCVYYDKGEGLPSKT